MNKLLIATNNRGKIAEYREIFADLPVTLTSLAEEGIYLDPEETGTTFEANAILKAEAFAQASGLLTLADDSGLEVDALDKAPGIYSARYGGTAKDEHVRRYQLVLDQIKDVSWEQRTGRFRCVVALAYREQIIGTAEGTVEGFITREPEGSGGFGYDPIFYYPDFEATLAQVPAEQKHSISHRGRAA
ncbi:MAG: RdgB/HAM1 family non-canonical purine NTP pyrophosphatase, partial [Anaerolineae bacterium]|nr:RdgB/HAM1 family non-canonical purine NTP pyrophosphatase [Anaerolineae bacterium]